MAYAPIQTAFSGNPLNRADHLRTDPEIFGAHMAHEDARVVLLARESLQAEDGSKVRIAGDYRILTGPDGDIAWQTPDVLNNLPVSERIFLGLDGTAARYAAILDGSADDFENRFAPATEKFRDGRGIAFKLQGTPGTPPHPSLGIIAQAKSMLMWHESHRFCAKCGMESNLVKAGYERQCPACSANHFPRTDPVVIMLVRHGDKALVGRGKGWPEGHYSALAGFMEPGESMEEAVAREISEEVGLKTTRVEYVASQPWPWPSTLMIGAEAWVEDGPITLQEAELEDAVWVTRDDVIASAQGKHPYRLTPPPFAIAYNLIMNWLSQK